MSAIVFAASGDPQTKGSAKAWTFTLPIDLPSANRHGGAATNARHRGQAAMYRRQRDHYVQALTVMARQVGIPNVRRAIEPAPFRRVEIVRLWGKGCRAWDDDNMVAACKGLRDAMQREREVATKGSRTLSIKPGAGLVWDDSARWSAWTYGQERSEDGKPGVRVTVTEAGHAGPVPA